MQFKHLQDRVRRYLMEMGTSQFPDGLVQYELNRSQRMLAKEFSLFRAAVSPTVTTWHFTPPADFDGFAGPARMNGYLLPVGDPAGVFGLDRDAFTASAQTGSPQMLAWGPGFNLGVPGDIYVWPTPPVTGVRIDLVYYRRPTDMSGAADQPWFGAWDDYHDLIALQAAQVLGAQNGSTGGRDGTWVQQLELRKEAFRGALAADFDNPPQQLRFGPNPIQNRRRTGWGR